MNSYTRFLKKFDSLFYSIFFSITHTLLNFFRAALFTNFSALIWKFALYVVHILFTPVAISEIQFNPRTLEYFFKWLCFIYLANKKRQVKWIKAVFVFKIFTSYFVWLKQNYEYCTSQYCIRSYDKAVTVFAIALLLRIKYKRARYHLFRVRRRKRYRRRHDAVGLWERGLVRGLWIAFERYGDDRTRRRRVIKRDERAKNKTYNTILSRKKTSPRGAVYACAQSLQK